LLHFFRGEIMENERPLEKEVNSRMFLYLRSARHSLPLAWGCDSCQ
jgi:hypothetical protein